jgi:hypothetical protein
MLPTDTEAMAKAAGSCNIDVMCTSGNQNEMHAVAKMVFGINGATSMCTGSLLNNTKNDRTPYFLSANHCISTQTVASSLQTIWNYRLASCGGSQVDSTMQTVNGGAILLYQTTSTDTSFMRLNGTPPSNATFAGWSANTAATSAAVFGIHHPAADLQKYSRGTITSIGSGFYDMVWTPNQGVTEPGSSGSALFTSSGRQLIGQLYGGYSSCANPTGADIYGRFDLAYNASLKTWLSPATTTVPIYGTATGTSGSISPASTMVQLGTAYTFTVKPGAGSSIMSISGCGGTAFSGVSATERTYTTGTITASCTVSAVFAVVDFFDDCSPASAGTNCTWSNLASPITKAIETAGDKDWIRFTPTASGLWTFTASKPASNPLNDSVGTLYNASGTQLAANDDGAGNLQFKVQATLTAGQTYYLEVRGWSSNTGNYTVTATRQ